ncbi:MAG: tRNA lysidine(34) synthetase TilS [bacterium]
MLNELHKHLSETRLLPPGSKILVAVSGGVDSVALLSLLSALADQYRWKLAVAHYNHGMRPDASHDAMLVGSLADQYGYTFFLGKYEYSDFSEAALRKARYDFLELIRRDTGYDYVVTAHHNNDFLETAIFNTIRGADREGMVALKPRRGNIVRPLLAFSKPELIVYANLQGLAYREDSSNSDVGYTRNFVRNVLLPHASIKYKNFHHNMNRRLANLTEINIKINAGLSRLADQMVDYEDKNSIQLDGQQFQQLPAVVQKSLLVFLVKRLQPSHGLSKINIAKAVKFIENSSSGTKMPLPGGLQLVNTYDKFVITSESQNYSENTNDTLHVLSAKKPFKNDLFKVAINADSRVGIKIPNQKLYVRYRQAGDRVGPVGMKGTKKLQDIFVDAKIPRHIRGHWPVVVTASNEIVWVPNLVKNRKFFENTADNYQYLTCEVI